MALSLDRKAFIDILSDGQGEIGGVMQPPPEGVWGMPPDLLKSYRATGPISRKTARKPAASWKSSARTRQRLKIEVSTREHADYRDPAVILIDN